MDYEFTHPVFLKLIYFTPIFWFIAVLGIKKLSLWRLILSAISRSFLFAVIVLALAGFSQVEKSAKNLSVVCLADVSGSIDDKGKEWIKEYIDKMDSELGKDIHKTVNIFALNSRQIYESDHEGGSNALSESKQTSIIKTGMESLNMDRTNIEGAVISVLGKFPQDSVKRILLITDGNENVGNAVKAALTARNEGVRIYTVNPPKSTLENKITLKKVLIPKEAPLGKTVEIRIVVDNKSGSYVNGNITTLLHKTGKSDSPEMFKQWDARFSPGLNVFKAEYKPLKKGLIKFETLFESKDEINIENSSIITSVVVTGKSKVLYVNGIEGRNLFLPDTLEDKNIEVDIVSPDEIPDTVLDMLIYDSVIFSNVSKSMLKPYMMEIMEQYVRDFGGGFVMLGGKNSFIQGGYSGTPIEDILPVKMEGGEHKRTEKRYRFSLILVIDKSASMSGQKITFAKKAALEIVNQLKDQDKLGVIVFDNNPYMIQDLRPIPAVKISIVNKLNRLQAGGGTNIFPALKMAYLSTVQSESKTNHVILLSDGNTEYLYYNKEALIKSYKDAKISISTIAIGKWFVNTNLLKDIAGRTGGSFYKIDDVVQLPKLIMKDVDDHLSKTDIHEEYFFPQKVTDSSILKDISQEQLPPLKGFSITTAKPGAETPLITDIRGKADPILANWRYGLGKTLAYTADAEARWSTDWIKWIKYNKFWSQALRWSMKDIPGSDYSLKIETVDNKPYLYIESFHKDELFSRPDQTHQTQVDHNDSPTELKIRLYSAETYENSKVSATGSQTAAVDPEYTNLLLRQIGPKKYISPLEKVAPGNYITNALFVKNDKILSTKTKSLIIPKFQPVAQTDSGKLYNNVQLLEKISQITGGKYNPTIDDIEFNIEQTKKLNNLSKYLIPIAFGFLLIDIALRKLK